MYVLQKTEAVLQRDTKLSRPRRSASITATAGRHVITKPIRQPKLMATVATRGSKFKEVSLIMMWTKLTIIMVLAMAIMAIPMASAMADWGPTGVYVDNTTAGFQLLNSNAQNAAWVLGYGNRPGFQSPDERVTCYMNEGARMAAAALGNQQQDVPVLFQINK